MKRSKRLMPVVDIAARKTEAALVKIGEANGRWVAEQQQLEELHRYKGEYLAKFRQVDSTLMMNAQKVLELRSFLSQLDQAIKAQEIQVETQYQELKKERVTWMQVRSKEQAMQSLVDRYQNEEVQVESKKEQQASDEHSAIQWRSKLR